MPRVLPPDVAVRLAQRTEGRECLALCRDVLAWVLEREICVREWVMKEEDRGRTSQILHSSLPESAVTGYCVPQALQMRRSSEVRRATLNLDMMRFLHECKGKMMPAMVEVVRCHHVGKVLLVRIYMPLSLAVGRGLVFKSILCH